MFKNYITIALRNLAKDRFFSLLKISGLIIGLASFVLIAAFIQYEYSYDRHYPGADRIFHVNSSIYVERMNMEESATIMGSPSILGPYLAENFPSIQATARVVGPWEGDFRHGSSAYRENKLFVVDKDFFEIFSIRCLSGSTEQMDQAGKLVLTLETAHKYFGNVDPIGKAMYWGEGLYTVVAVVESMPVTSSFNFSIIASRESIAADLEESWSEFNVVTYLKLSEGADINTINKKMEGVFNREIDKAVKEYFNASLENSQFNIEFESIKDIHINSYSYRGRNNLARLVTLLGTASFILLLACINFINLSSTASLKRSAEIGLRKANGAQRKDIIFQFLSESIIISLFSYVAALPIVWYCLPQFSKIVGADIQLVYITQTQFIAGGVVFSLLLGVLAGLFPALYISSASTLASLKGTLNSGNKSVAIRKVLVVFQFSITIITMFMTILFDSQVEFLANKDLGFDKENILVIRGANTIFRNKEECRGEILSHPEIQNFTFMTTTPGHTDEGNSYQIEGKDPNYIVDFGVLKCDEHYLDTYELELAEGRFFSDVPEDSLSIVINEYAVALYDIQDPIGKHILAPAEDQTLKKLKIVGVVKDFNFVTVKSEIFPLIIRNSLPSWTDKIYMRTKAGETAKVVEILKAIWDEKAPNSPFKYEVLDDVLDSYLDVERLIQKVLVTFTGLTLFISCLGILGLITFTSSLRTKEIGIRKTNGASVFGIVFLLTKGSLWLCLVSILIALPVSYIVGTQVLTLVSFPVPLKPVFFIVPSLVIVLLTFITESTVTAKAAIMNPVKALRYE